jgi:hypothetical protein
MAMGFDLRRAAPVVSGPLAWLLRSFRCAAVLATLDLGPPPSQALIAQIIENAAKSSLAVNNSSVAGSPVSRYRARSSAAALHSVAVIRMRTTSTLRSPSASLTSATGGRVGPLTWMGRLTRHGRPRTLGARCRSGVAGAQFSSRASSRLSLAESRWAAAFLPRPCRLQGSAGVVDALTYRRNVFRHPWRSLIV